MNSPLPHMLVAGADEDSAKRRQILAGARQVFLDLGFDGASMGEIAKAAGVSKGTLYVYFTDKHTLFEAMCECEMRGQGIEKLSIDPDDDVANVLRKFGQGYMELLCRPQGGSTVRTIMAIAERMPELGRRYYHNVPANWIGKLADYLDDQAKAGRLEIPNTELAASQFLTACQATLFLPFIFQITPPPSAERIAEVVESAVRMFLAAYQVKPQTT